MLGNYAVKAGKALLVDDYGHHPTEVRATIQAVRDGWPGKRLVMVFQPHRFSRTRDFYDDFVQVLSQVDELLLLDVYPAGEVEIPSISSQNLCISIGNRSTLKPIYVEHIEIVPILLNDLVRDDDMVLTQGAGSVSQLVAMLRSTGGSNL
jgi:UDP-N-acetylmuramate--alanine ligase